MCSVRDTKDYAESVCSPVMESYKTEEDFSDEQWQLLIARTGLASIDSVCANHELSFIDGFEEKHPTCVDPDRRHPRVRRDVAERISYNLFVMTRNAYPSLKPGHGCCAGCYVSLVKKSRELLKMQITGDSSFTLDLKQCLPTSIKHEISPFGKTSCASDQNYSANEFKKGKSPVEDTSCASDHNYSDDEIKIEYEMLDSTAPFFFIAPKTEPVEDLDEMGLPSSQREEIEREIMKQEQRLRKVQQLRQQYCAGQQLSE